SEERWDQRGDGVAGLPQRGGQRPLLQSARGQCEDGTVKRFARRKIHPESTLGQWVECAEAAARSRLDVEPFGRPGEAVDDRRGLVRDREHTPVFLGFETYAVGLEPCLGIARLKLVEGSAELLFPSR